jgi:hypothetical protein
MVLYNYGIPIDEKFKTKGTIVTFQLRSQTIQQRQTYGNVLKLLSKNRSADHNAIRYCEPQNSEKLAHGVRRDNQRYRCFIVDEYGQGLIASTTVLDEAKPCLIVNRRIVDCLHDEHQDY